ncbi:DUF3347 domain-containing protein [Flagellimonas profundi]|uniref:DUF3347 domain-containing protein n=1 Tax=Flagellimonas profundi TaxID=2915620 RepID=A0ABS3FC56_9FLAO|nr:DUF3347 domain-containing protein [Allomuricauda profundi]MBO0340692.1 DUF3347 domain-containing protein [Allomuricauda profundi]
MKKANATTGILAMAIIALSVTSCKDKKKEQESQDGHHMEQMEDSGTMEDHSQMDHGEMAMMSSEVIADYLTLKNALVSDDKDGAAKAGEKLESSLKRFDMGKFGDEQQDELRDIVEDATEHAEHIAKSDIGHQREHFDVLSKDIIDLLAITGSDRTLYQAYCPMYNNNKGAQWLSASKEIKNPYYGSKMMTCGEVQKEIK